MRYQELRQPFAKPNSWRITVAIAMVILAFVLAAKLIYNPKGSSASALDFLEIAGITVLFIDLAVNFTRAESKRRFIQEKWFEILLFVPFTALFEAFRVYEIFEVMGFRALPFILRTKLIVDEGNALAGLSKSEPFQFAKLAVIGVVLIPDKYKTMKYRGLLRF